MFYVCVYSFRCDSHHSFVSTPHDARDLSHICLLLQGTTSHLHKSKHVLAHHQQAHRDFHLFSVVNEATESSFKLLSRVNCPDSLSETSLNCPSKGSTELWKSLVPVPGSVFKRSWQVKNADSSRRRTIFQVDII